MILGLVEWIRGTYGNCQDPTIGRDEEETPELFECIKCGETFERGEGKLLDSEDYWCNKCCNQETVYAFYREVADLTDRQLYDMKVVEI